MFKLFGLLVFLVASLSNSLVNTQSLEDIVNGGNS